MRAQILMTAFSLIVSAVGLSGCAEHYTTQEAYDICQEQQDRNPGAIPEEAFPTCVACYEDCGSQCEMTSDAPAVFSCPE